MVVWHRMLGRVQKTLMVAGCAGVLAAALPSTASAQSSVSGTEWYRQQPPTGGLAGQQVAQADPQQPGGAPTQPNNVAPPPAPAQPPAMAPPPPPAAPSTTFAPPAVNPGAGIRPYQMPPAGGPYSGYGSSSGLFPSFEVNNYVLASARAATARALFRQAESELGQAYRSAQRQFDASADYKAALKDERDAYAALNAARTKAFASLDGDKKYQRLLALRQDLAERLNEGRARRTLGSEEIMAMATLKMSYANEMRAIEAGALSNESSVKEAQERLVSAGQRVSVLRQRFDEAVRNNSDILMARRNMEDARVARLTADAYLRAATIGGSYAVDYAYYLYRTPNYRNTGWNGYNRF